MKIPKIEIGKWVRGWRLDKFFDSLFNNDAQVGQPISVVTAINQTIEFTDKVQEFIDSPMIKLLEESRFFPENWDESTFQKARYYIPIINERLRSINTAEDIPGAISDIRFSEDEKVNNIVQSSVKCASSIFSDGRLSANDFTYFVQLIYELG